MVVVVGVSSGFIGLILGSGFPLLGEVVVDDEAATASVSHSAKR